ncbi:MAG TPA: CHAT domain-containing protein [Gemmataceae bacterium]|nr:CHAT domain-containing protein [Gemmataceae bacterium]
MKSALLTMVVFLSAGQTGDRTKLKWFEENAYKAANLAQDGKKKEALALIDEMHKEAVSQKNDERQLYVQMFKGVCEFYVGDLNQSIRTLKDMESKEANQRFRHQVYRNLGDAYLASGQAKQAEDSLLTALKLNDQAKVLRFPPEDLVNIKIELAQCKIGQGSVKEARKQLAGLKDEIDSIKKDADPTDWACLNARLKMLNAEADLDARNPLRALLRLEDSQKSLRPFTKSREAVDLRFRCHIALAADYWLLARFSDAATHLDAAEALVSTVKTDRNQATIKNARAALLIEKSMLAIEDDPTSPEIIDDLKDAETNLNKALEHLTANNGEDVLAATVNFQLAQVYDLRGRAYAAGNKNKEADGEYQKGKQRVEKALQWYTSVGYPADHVTVLELRNRRTWLTLRLGDAREAQKDGIEALKLFDKNHTPSDLDRGRYLHVLMDVEEKLGNVAAAAKYAGEQRKHVDDGLGMILAGLSAPEQVQFFRRWDTPAFNASLRLGLQHADDPELLASSIEWLINGKAKVTEVLAAQAKQTRRADKQVFGKFQSIVQREAYLLYGEPTAQAQDLREQLLVEEASKRDLAKEAVGNEKASQPRWYTLQEVRGNLAEGEVYVGIHSMRATAASPRAYEAWLLPKQGPVKTVKLGSADEIDRLIKIFVREQENVPLIAPGQEKRAEQLLRDKCLRRLSTLVLEPIRAAVGNSHRWVVSPDGPLWNVPWATLVLPESDRYAIEEYTFRYAISGRDLVPADGRGKVGEALVLGDPWFNYPNSDPRRLRKPGVDPLRIPWDRLEYSERDCDTVFAIMRDSNLQPRRLTGLFQKDRLFELPEAPKMMYLSTHAFATLPSKVRVDDPLMQCAIALAGWNYLPESKKSLPGMMTGAEVLGIDLRGTELVVLASCESEPALVMSGQSPANLRHAFHLAGARAVVSSLWGINDKSTLDVLEPFMYAACRAEADKVVALRDAQQQQIRYLRMYRDHSHPYFWAGFTMSGS